MKEAFRIFAKINSKTFSNVCKRFSLDVRCGASQKTEATLPAAETAPEINATDDVPEPTPQEAAPAELNILRERTFPKNPTSAADQNQAMDYRRQLQPSKMPTFFNTDADAGVRFPNLQDEQIKNRRPYQEQGETGTSFAQSKTHANLTMPLKPVKLADPFPAPVKVMMSHTVSDDEKAQQMLQEAKNQRMSNNSQWGKSMPDGKTKQHAKMTNNKRWFSTIQSQGAQKEVPEEVDEVQQGRQSEDESERQIFPMSMTRASLTQPLNHVNLASPFPAPLKSKMSYGVSDKEKAQIMQQEAKSQKIESNSAEKTGKTN